MSEWIDEETPIADAERKAIRDGLKSFNLGHMTEGEREPVELVLRDTEGRICGGLLGHTRWHWLIISTLWIADEFRGKGYGKALLQRAEQIGRDRSCQSVATDTAGFQAIGFYLALGYTPFGELLDYPPGSRTVYLYKNLVKVKDI